MGTRASQTKSARGKVKPQRFLLAGFGTRGDLEPLFVLAKELGTRGHVVRVAAPPDFAEEAKQRGLDFHPVGTSVQQLFRGPALKAHEVPARVQEELRRHFTELSPLAEGVQLVVSTAGEVSAASVAEAAGAGHLHLALGPQTIPSTGLPPPYVPLPSLPRFLSRLSWGAIGTVLNTFGRTMLNQERKRLGLAGVSDLLAHLLPTRALLAVDPLLAPVPDALAQTVWQVGPLLEEVDGPLSREVEAFLADGPPPVFMGFGSMTGSRAEQTTRTLLAAVRARGQRAIIERGWGGLGAGASGDDVLVVEQAPHARLFPRVSSVIHHGASGTVAHAAWAGVPQIVIPHLLDQPYWGERVHALGLGPKPLSKDGLEVGAVASALATATSVEVIARARDLAPRLQRDGATSAADRLEALAAKPCEPLVSSTTDP